MTEKKTVLITGSSRGLGRSLALTFARNNYNLIIHGRDVERLDGVKKDVLGLGMGVECEIVIGDLASDMTIEKLAKAAREMGLDVLINNAGVFLKKEIVDVSDRALREVIETNLLAPMLLTKRLLTILSWKLKGTVVNINSIAGKNPNAEESVYCASKHGLRGFTSSLQLRSGARIIDVYLGAMKTDMTRMREGFEKLIDPNDVAEAIFALCENYESLKIKEVMIGRKVY